MTFNSYPFLFGFLPVTLAGYWALRRWKLHTVWLLGMSLVFYAAAGVGYLALLVVMTGGTYAAGRFLLTGERNGRRKAGLAVVLANLLVLMFFKYAGLLAAPLGSDALQQVALPLGISFYTFNLVSYGLDVYRRLIPAERSLMRFAATITFFPTILSGPLTRYAEMRGQQDTVQYDGALALFTFTLGLAKKVLIADTLAAQVNPLFADPANLGMIAAWAAVLGYAYQLYFDFSGYTDMATGMAYALGFRLPQNFNAPYSARNITEFWQKWHMTLSEWFRAYLFLPLSRTLLRRLPTHPDAVRTMSLVVTMTLTGVWHGSTWGFVLWGAYHGVLLAIHAQSRRWRWKPLPVGLARGMTFGAVLVGWVMFRAESMEAALGLYRGMVGLNGIQRQYLWGETNPGGLILMLAALLVVTNVPRDTWGLRPRNTWWYAAAVAILLVVSVAFISQTTTFLYLQF
ncbi:MAG: MBOAT family protein [Anaerolineae bacterium]|nr:MBOAT family protein [Anaerolineae bacterium]